MPPGRTSAAALAQRRSASSAARRSGRDEQRPAVEQQRGAVAARAQRLGAGRGDDDRRLGAHLGQHLAAPGGPHRDAGERAAELLGGAAANRRPRRACRGRRTSGSVHSAAGRPHHRQAGDGALGRGRERAGADRAAGRACGRGHRPAPARTRRAAPGRAPAGPRPARRGWCARPGSAAGRRPRPGRGRSRRRRPTGRTRGAAAAQHGAVGGDLVRPAGLDELLRLGGAGVRRRRAAPRRSGPSAAPARRGCAGTGARGSACRSSPSSQIASRPRSATGAYAAARVPITTRTVAAPHGQPAPVALGRAEVGGQRDVPARAERNRQGGVETVRSRASGTTTIAPRPASTRGAGRLGEPGRPVLARQRRPHRPRRPARRRPRPGRPARRGSGRTRSSGGGGQVAGRPAARPGLGRGVPGRDAEPHDVDEVAGPAVGDGAEQRGGLGGQHRLAADRPLDEREPALVLGAAPAARGRRRRRAGRRTAPGPATRPGPRSSRVAGTR